jgi:hypothetical protein
MERQVSASYITSAEAARLIRISEEAFLREIDSRRIVFSTIASPDTGETLFLLSDVVYLLQKFTEAPPELPLSNSEWLLKIPSRT